MEEFDTMEANARTHGVDNEDIKLQVWEFVIKLVKRVILFISFGTGVFGFLWLLGRIFKR